MQQVEVFVSLASNPVRGKWIELPMEETKLSQKVRQITNSQAYKLTRDYMIPDYIADFKINQYENILKLNHFVSSLDELYKEQQLATLYLIKVIGYSREEALDKCVDVQVWIDSDLEDVAYELVENGCFGNVPDAIKYYIDYEDLGSSLELDGWYYDKDNHCCYHYA